MAINGLYAVYSRALPLVKSFWPKIVVHWYYIYRLASSY